MSQECYLGYGKIPIEEYRRQKANTEDNSLTKGFKLLSDFELYLYTLIATR